MACSCSGSMHSQRMYAPSRHPRVPGTPPATPLHGTRSGKGRTYYACQPKKDQHQDADWYASHPKAVWTSKRVMLEAIRAFFEDRIFGPQSRQFLEAAMSTTTASGSPDRSVDIQNLKNETDSLTRRKELLLDQLASLDENDGDPEIAAEFRKGIRRRFDALEHKRRAALAQLESYRAEAAPDRLGDPVSSKRSLSWAFGSRSSRRAET